MSDGGDRIFVIGLDGATLDIILPLVNEGRLPTFSRLIRTGAWGPLVSTTPPFTAPAWTTFMTGKNGGKHGIFDILSPGRDGYPRHYVNATDIDSACMWDIFKLEEKQVGLMEIPMTFPPRPVPGFMISGMMTPSSDVVHTHPADLQVELMLELGDFPIETTYLRGLKPRNIEEMVRRLAAWTENRRRAVLYLMKRYPWDFFMVVFRGTDIVQHLGWRFDDQMTREHFPVETEKYQRAVKQYYEKIDRVCEEILDQLDDGTTVVIMSDHGGACVSRYFWINRWLAEEGYLALKGGSFSTRKLNLSTYTLGDAMERFGLPRSPEFFRRVRVAVPRRRACEGEELIDWEHTRAYGNWRGVGECISLNVRGREAKGVVEPGAEEERLRQELIERLTAMKDSMTGQPLLKHVFRKEELFSGPYAHEAADLYLAAFTPSCCLRRQLTPGPVFTTPVAAHGGHSQEGILFLAGPNLRSDVRLEGATLADVAPTILHLMGLSVPEDMDGKVLVSAMSDDYLHSHPVSYRPPVPWRGGEEMSYTREEVSRLEDALRGLGYVD